MPLFVTVTPGTTVTNSTTLDATTLNLLGTPSVDVTGTVDGGSLTLSAGSVTTVAIADNAVTFAKLDNIDGDRLIGRDDAGSGDPTQISVGGGLQFTGSNSIEIGNGLVTYAKIQNTAAGKRLIGRAGTAGGTVGEIEVGGGLALSDGGVLSSVGVAAKFISGLIAIPTTLTYITDGATPTPAAGIPHGLSGVPDILFTYLVCDNAGGSLGYANGDVIPLDRVGAINWAHAFNPTADGSRIYCSRMSTGIFIITKQTGVQENLWYGNTDLRSQWKLKFVAIKFTA